jgi:hypothetical protein
MQAYPARCAAADSALAKAELGRKDQELVRTVSHRGRRSPPRRVDGVRAKAPSRAVMGTADVYRRIVQRPRVPTRIKAFAELEAAVIIVGRRGSEPTTSASAG